MISMKTFLTLTAAMVISLGIVSFNTHADVVISGTRIVYPQQAKDVSVRLENRGERPLLVQIWLDDGRDNTNPQELKLPFILTPPVSRMDAKRGQTIRITYLGDALPQDRETLYWFNMLEIPPKSASNQNQNLLQLAFRTRIKMFYRPAGLNGDPGLAAQTLRWNLVEESGGVKVNVINESPYFVSLSSAAVKANNQSYRIVTETLPPKSTTSLAVKDLTQSPANAKVIYNAINDYGGTIKSESEMGSP